MRFNFLLKNIKPFSVNSMYYSTSTSKTQKYHDWSFQIFSRLSNEQIQVGLRELREYFEVEKHAYVVRLTAYYPEATYYRRIGGISAKTMDLSNWEKPLVDCIFLPKHHKNSPPYGSPNLNIDDRYICSLVSRKLPTMDKEPSIRIQVAIVDLPSMPEPCPHQESHIADPQNQPGESA